MKSAIYAGKLMHNRLRPKRHHFSYNVASWVFDLDEVETLDKTLHLFSYNRFNFISFHSRDYGDSDTNSNHRSLRDYVEHLLGLQNIPSPEHIYLLCYPRIMGYVFNPLAVYFCYGHNNKLLAVIYEVSNTFKERHSYVIPADQHDIGTIRQRAEKKLHVSPFFQTTGCHYHFKVKPPAESVSLAISLHDTQGKLFGAVFNGQKKDIHDVQILKQLISLPLMTLKVVAAIHWEALRLWLKGIAIIPHKAVERFNWSPGTNSAKRETSHLKASHGEGKL